MPLINKYKIINFKYGKGVDRLLSNRTMELYGDNLQVEAENTAGKTMSIQTAIQSVCPLSNVAKPFSAIYTKKEPVYSLIEWILDDDKTLLLTGIGFERKAGSSNEQKKERKDDLYKYFTFIIEESAEIGINIENIPLLKNNANGNKVVQSLASTEEYIKNLQAKYGKSKIHFFNSNGKKAYRERLGEYGISQSEWKEVIIKLNNNNKEGGLSEFVNEYNTGEKLIRDSILPLIESSLSNKGDGMAQIVVLKDQVRKCLNNIIEMKDKLADHKNYIYLNEFIGDIELKLQEILKLNEEERNIRDELASLYMYIRNKKKALEEKINFYKKEEILKTQEKSQIKYEEDSYTYNSKNTEIEGLKVRLKNIARKISKESDDKDLNTQYLNILKYKDKKSQIEEEELDKVKKETEKNKKDKSYEEIVKVLNELGSSIHFYLLEDIKEINVKLKENNDRDSEYKRKKEDLKNYKKKIEETLIDIESKNKSILEMQNKHEKVIENFKEKNRDINKFISYSFFGEIIDFGNYLNVIEKEAFEVNNTILSEEKEIEDKNKEISNISTEINRLSEKKQQVINKLEKLERRKEESDEILREYRKINEKFEINERLEETSKLNISIKNVLLNLNLNKDNFIDKRNELRKQLDELENYKTINLDEEILGELDKKGIKPIEGIKYIINLPVDIEYKKNLILKNPLLPYSIIITNGEYEKLKNIQLKNKTKISIPILIRDKIEEGFFTISNNLTISNDVNILTSFDTSTLDPEKRISDIEKVKSHIKIIKDKIEEIEYEYDELKDFMAKTNVLKYTTNDLNIDKEISEYKREKISLSNKIKSKEGKIEKFNIKVKKLNSNKGNLFLEKNQYENKLNEIKKLENEYYIIAKNRSKLKDNENKIEKVTQIITSTDEEIDQIESNINGLYKIKIVLKSDLKIQESEIDRFKMYESKNIVNLELKELKVKYKRYSEDSTAKEIKDLNEDIEKILKRIETYKKELSGFESKINIPNFEQIVIPYESEELDVKLSSNDNKLEKLNNEREEIDKTISGIKGEIKTIKGNIFDNFDGKEPCDTSLIKDFNFKERRENIKKELKNIESNIKINNEECSKLEQELRDLKKYKREDAVIINQPQNVFNESRRLQNLLDTIKSDSNELKYNYNNMVIDLREFNIKNQNKYEKIIESLMINKDIYEKQLRQVDIVLLVIREEISKVEKHSEQVENEKNLISRHVKDYVIDCIEEFKIINKLGKHKGQQLFKIRLPKQEKIENSLHLVNILMDEIVEDMNLDDVDQKINTFYILNRIINIGTIPISIIKYEINRTDTIKWNSISNETTGGQRFCMSFIMTTLLLEYKRYDRNAIIDISKYKGKVLLMDNPFGETSQQDFLKEIFELAKKFRVQIISYSHITNASVRGMFNKIYLMTVEKTTSNKEFVDISEIKKSKNEHKESVSMNKFNIRAIERVEQDDLFKLIN
ncbi:coiled-coil domain-containing protein [Tepidibacter mesophilus]|uniref:hypothetical protein n=1 Tax=Tepidibacter mesophilus TaxID=655607 RepID=UPI000C07C202|nr:hypothetical protein [Tepidibacter mesophilus]